VGADARKNKKAGLPENVCPLAARLSSLSKVRCFPSSSHEEFGFIRNAVVFLVLTYCFYALFLFPSPVGADARKNKKPGCQRTSVLWQPGCLLYRRSVAFRPLLAKSLALSGMH